MNFSEGQPKAPIGGGYRMLGRLNYTWAGTLSSPHHVVAITRSVSNSYASEMTVWRSNNCLLMGSLDRKFDDGLPFHGRVTSYLCGVPFAYGNSSAYYANTANMGDFLYEFMF